MYLKAKKLPSVELLKERFEIDPSIPSGLRWKINPGVGRAKAGDPAGRCNASSYFQTGINGERFLNSRIIWKMVTGVDPKGVVDHIDNKPRGNNSFANFQDITQQQNLSKKPGEIVNA